LKIGDKSDFLDLTFNNNLEFDWYRKPTFSAKFINFMSSHPPSKKRRVIMNIVDKAILLRIPNIIKKIYPLLLKHF